MKLLRNITIILFIIYSLSHTMFEVYAAEVYHFSGYDISNLDELNDVQKIGDKYLKDLEDIQNSDASDEEKKEAVAAISKEIDAFNKEYGSLSISKKIKSRKDALYNSSSDFWGQANNWFEQGQSDYGDITTINPLATGIINEFKNMVNVLGTTVIVLVTIFLGIKYIYGSFESKAEVKDGLIGLLVACVFFFGWTSIWELLFQRRQFRFYRRY